MTRLLTDKRTAPRDGNPHALEEHPNHGGNGDSAKPVGRVRQMVYWTLAGFFFSLAMIGVVLPGIPTTPFLLLMCHFLIRVSPALHARAMAWPVVGGPLRDWHDQHGVRTSVRITACTMVLLLVSATLVFGSLPMIVKMVIVCAAIYGISVVIRLPTARVNASRWRGLRHLSSLRAALANVLAMPQGAKRAIFQSASVRW